MDMSVSGYIHDVLYIRLWKRRAGDGNMAGIAMAKALLISLVEEAGVSPEDRD